MKLSYGLRRLAEIARVLVRLNRGAGFACPWRALERFFSTKLREFY